MRAMASQTKWCLRLDSENKLTVLLNRLPMRKPNGEEYSHVTFIERGNSAIQVKFHFENSKSARSLFRTDFDGEMDDFNEKLSAAAVLSNTAFINLVIKETGVASKKRQLLEKGSSAKRPRLASDTQEMPGSQKQIFVNSTDFGDKYLGQFDLRLNILEAAPTTFSVRTIRNGWVKELKARILRNPGKAPVIIPAVIAGNECAGKENFTATDLSTYTIYALGGNHLISAMKEVIADNQELSYMSNIRVDLYAGITELEARSIANRHNAKLRSLDITFQDKVRQARWLKENGAEHLTTETAKMLSDVTLQEVPKESVTTIVSVANYGEVAYNLTENIFEKYEDSYGIGRSVPVKLFKTLQGPAFSTAEKERYLRLALDTSLVQAGVEAEREKKIKSVQKTFVEQTTCVDWQEAKELYPEHTNEAVISKLADFKVQRETIPKTLIKHIESAKADMPLAKEPEIDLKVYRGGVEVDISTFPEMIRLVNKTKLKIGKLLNKTIAANED